MEAQVGEMMDAMKLNGVRVIAADSYSLGEVDGVNVDTKQWRVTHLKVGLSDEAVRELGYSKPLLGSVKICLPVEFVSGYGDVVTLKKSLMELKGSSECKAKR
jgi:sporulation protein YlmC with PRC-barrel domain